MKVAASAALSIQLWLGAAQAAVPSDFTGIVVSGNEFARPACRRSDWPVFNVLAPDFLVPLQSNERAVAFYHETLFGGAIYLQVREGDGPWREMSGVAIHFSGECHPLPPLQGKPIGPR